MTFGEFSEYVEAHLADVPDDQREATPSRELIFRFFAGIYAENLQEMPSEELADLLITGSIEMVNEKFIFHNHLEDADLEEVRSTAAAIARMATKKVI